MGPYDNELGQYIQDDNVMNAIWLEEIDTGGLYIVPRENDGFEIYGPGDDIEDKLNELSYDDLADEQILEELGLMEVQPSLRRFCPTTGYYAA